MKLTGRCDWFAIGLIVAALMWLSPGFVLFAAIIIQTVFRP